MPIVSLKPKPAARVLPALVLASMLGACGATQDDRSANGEATIRDDAEGSPASENQAATPTDTTARTLAPERQLQVVVEGDTELRAARLFESPQGYAIYVLPQVEMTQEEPCCDLAYARIDQAYFMRIERLAGERDAEALHALRADMALALSAVGPAEEAPAPGAGEALAHAVDAHDIELHLHARNASTTMHMLLLRAGDGRYRMTLHLPNGEASEGIAPTFWAMLGSLETTAPLSHP